MIISGSWKNVVFLLVYLILQKGTLHYSYFLDPFLMPLDKKDVSYLPNLMLLVR